MGQNIKYLSYRMEVEGKGSPGPSKTDRRTGERGEGLEAFPFLPLPNPSLGKPPLLSSRREEGGSRTSPRLIKNHEPI
jgi:hypothetical protein